MADDLAARIRNLVAQARAGLTRAQGWQKAHFDRHHADVTFGVGDRVLLSTRNLRLTGGKKLG